MRSSTHFNGIAVKHKINFKIAVAIAAMVGVGGMARYAQDNSADNYSLISPSGVAFADRWPTSTHSHKEIAPSLRVREAPLHREESSS